MMALSTDPALSLSQFLANSQAFLNRSPDKVPNMEEILQRMISGEMAVFGNNPLQTDMSNLVSSGSTSPRNDSPNSEEAVVDTPMQNKEPRNYRLEPWHECFTTTSHAEFEALIYSVYVLQREDKKLDGYEYYECLNRLQSKCRYRVRVKRMNEFYIVEEKGAHNHAMEPVGTPGTHAGLPKTLREIVDTSFREEWAHSQRQAALDEEVKRLGLPHNPRLSRQVDNRIAYLRRVKNLSEMRKLQDQLPNGQSNQITLPSNDSQSQMSSDSPETPPPGDLLRMVMQLANGNQENSQDSNRLLSLMINNGMPMPTANDNTEKENEQMMDDEEKPMIDVNEDSDYKQDVHSDCSSPNGMSMESNDEN
ncbi:unnamed protein product [Auanema sp. JU1783]|nr:unnamed protein product [Auanema sp. JU1783]